MKYMGSKNRIFGLHLYRVWIPYVKVRGADEPWAHRSKTNAINNLLTQVKEDTIIPDQYWD